MARFAEDGIPFALCCKMPDEIMRFLLEEDRPKIWARGCGKVETRKWIRVHEEMLKAYRDRHPRKRGDLTDGLYGPP